jgi:hypothetical protein
MSDPSPLLAAPPPDRTRRRWLAAAAALAAAKLWLAAGLQVTAYGPAGHDDRLFLLMAQRILNGAWLGRPYGPMALAKGPFYSLFILGTWALGLPLLLAEQILYVSACGLLVVAVRPWLASRGARLALFAVLLLNPLTWHHQPATRVVREGIYPALALLVIACAAGLASRLDRPRPVPARWAAGLGLALSAFWLTREEGPWIVPGLLVLALPAALRWREVWRPALRAAPAFLVAGAVLPAAIASMNAARYGTFATNEFREGPFRSAVGALQRVDHARWRAWVPVPAEARLRIYEASPRFAELRPWLEGPAGRVWAEASCTGTGGAICDELAGGWFAWALRDAVEAAGYYGRGGRAVAGYYRALADEVNAACDSKLLACGPRRASLMPPLRAEHLPALRQAMLRAARLLLVPEDQAGPSESFGSWEDLALFRDLTRDRLAPAAGGAGEPTAWRGFHQARLDRPRIAALRAVGVAWRALLSPLVAAALLAFGWAVLGDLRRRRASGPVALAAALLAGVLARVVLLSLVDATSFAGVNSLYLSAAEPLLLAFVVVALAEPAGALATLVKRRAPGPGRAAPP